jgi:GNAT superfamily N-acetyltransferase
MSSHNSAEGIKIPYGDPRDELANQAAELLSPMVWGYRIGDIATYTTEYLSPREDTLYGLCDDEQLLGAAQVQHNASDENLINQAHTAVIAIKVREELHKLGLGRKLMGYIGLQAIAHNDSLVAAASYRNSEPYYQTLGFTRVGDPEYRMYTAQAADLAPKYTLPTKYGA